MVRSLLISQRRRSKRQTASNVLWHRSHVCTRGVQAHYNMAAREATDGRTPYKRAILSRWLSRSHLSEVARKPASAFASSPSCKGGKGRNTYVRRSP